MNKSLKHTYSKVSGFAIVIASYLLAIVADYFFFNGFIGISYPIFTLLFIAAFIILLAFQKRLKPNLNWLFFIPIIILSAHFAISDNHSLRAINFLLIPFLLISTFILITNTEGYKWFKFEFVETFFARTFNSFVELLSPYKNLVPKLKFLGNMKPLFGRIFVALLIAIPLAIVILVLLMSADIIFTKIIDSYFDIFADLNLDDWLTHLIRIFFIGFLLGGFLFALINVFYPKTNRAELEKEIDPIIPSIILTLVNAIYIFFSIIQFSYLFGDSSSIFDFGITYSEYAVSGFYELLTLAAINIAIILPFAQFSKFKQASGKMFVKIQLILMNLLTFVLIASSHVRLGIYEDIYGYTHARIYSHFTVFFLLFVFLYLPYKILYPKKSYFTKVAVIIALVMYSGLNLINLEQFIVERNIARYEEKGDIDVTYFEELSADAIPTIVDFREKVDDYKKFIITNNLKKQADKLKEIESESWYSYNYSRANAYNLLKNEELESGIIKLDPKCEKSHAVSCIGKRIPNSIQNNYLGGRAPAHFPEGTTQKQIIKEMKLHLYGIADKYPLRRVQAIIHFNRKISSKEFMKIYEEYDFSQQYYNRSEYFIFTDDDGKERKVNIEDIGKDPSLTADSIAFWATTSDLLRLWLEEKHPVKAIGVVGTYNNQQLGELMEGIWAL